MTYFGNYFGDYAETGSASGTWSAAGLVQLCKRLSGRPTNDTEMSELRWCELLSIGQAHWLPIIATKVPESQYGAPVALTMSEDRKTASFPAGVVPFGAVEIYDGVGGRRMTPGPYHDPSADFVPEGSTIRAPMDRELSASSELYARYVDIANTDIYTAAAASAAGGVAREPILLPEHARILIVYHALALWAAQGGYRDPSYFEHLEIKAAWDDPATGKLGIVTTLMQQFQDQGVTAAAEYVWWKSGDLGNLRHMHRVR